MEMGQPRTATKIQRDMLEADRRWRAVEVKFAEDFARPVIERMTVILANRYEKDS